MAAPSLPNQSDVGAERHRVPFQFHIVLYDVLITRVKCGNMDGRKMDGWRCSWTGVVVVFGYVDMDEATLSIAAARRPF